MSRALAMAAVVALLALPAHAGDTRTWGTPFYQSTIRLQPTEAPGAVAEVVFDNKTVHTDEDVSFTLDMGGFAVEVFAEVGRGMTPDRMTVFPPDGFLAVPQEIDVPEDDVGRVLIYEWAGM